MEKSSKGAYAFSSAESPSKISIVLEKSLKMTKDLPLSYPVFRSKL
jgi:hypothetical protein